MHAPAQQILRVVKLEGQADQCRDGSQCDVSFCPIQSQIDFTILPPENLPPALHPAGVRSCRWLSQGKARNFLPSCKPGQVVIFLMFRTVVHQKFCRTKGVRNHHLCCKRAAATAMNSSLKMSIYFFVSYSFPVFPPNLFFYPFHI